MNLLHGDHVAPLAPPLSATTVMVGSHEIGSPYTTLARGRAYGLCSLRTIDVRGDRGSAE